MAIAGSQSALVLKALHSLTLLPFQLQQQQKIRCGSWVLKQKQALCFVPLDMKLPVISYNCSMIPIQSRPQTTSKQVSLIVRGSRQKERVTAKEFKLKM